MRTLAAVAMISALLVAGCSNEVEGTPQIGPPPGGDPIRSEDGKSTIRNPRKLDPGFDCEKLITAKEFADIFPSTTATLGENTASTCVWSLTGTVSGAADIVRTGTSRGDQVADFEDNTTFKSDLGPGTCTLYVAVNRTKYLIGEMRLSDQSADACEMTRKWLKVVFDRLPKGQDG